MLTLTGDLANVLYYIADPADPAITLPFSQTESTCTITHSLYFYVTNTQSWIAWSAGTFPYAAWNSVNGELTISTSDYTYD